MNEPRFSVPVVKETIRCMRERLNDPGVGLHSAECRLSLPMAESLLVALSMRDEELQRELTLLREAVTLAAKALKTIEDATRVEWGARMWAQKNAVDNLAAELRQLLANVDLEPTDA